MHAIGITFGLPNSAPAGISYDYAIRIRDGILKTKMQL